VTEGAEQLAALDVVAVEALLRSPQRAQHAVIVAIVLHDDIVIAALHELEKIAWKCGFGSKSNLKPKSIVLNSIQECRASSGIGSADSVEAWPYGRDETFNRR
jgi:hypothetical protein